MSDAPNPDMLERARAELQHWIQPTPMLELPELQSPARGRIHVKAELFQRTGSFKLRGVVTKLLMLDRVARSRGVVTVSAGNHAIALAYACAQLEVRARVYMWAGANPLKVDRARRLGAEVNLEADSPAGAFQLLAAAEAEEGLAVVHPFDDPAVISGQGTVGLELLEQLPRVDTIVVPTSGGSLLSGIVLACRATQSDVRIVAVQAANSPSLVAALAAGRPVPVEQRRTVADALTAPMFGGCCFEVCKDSVAEVVVLDEEEIGRGLRDVYALARLACEPGGSVALAAVLSGAVSTSPGETVCTVVTGGNVDPSVIGRVLSA